LKLHGMGIGWIDAHLLAAALLTRVDVLTLDGPLQKLSARL
jgi:hypothetical protein